MSWFFGKFKSYLSVSVRPSGQVGFTMLELLVVISIFLVITGVVIADIPSFRTKSSLDLITSEVATYVRGAQVYGATQKGGDVNDDNVSYGIRFIKDTSSFFLFQNTNYDSPVETYNITGFKITKITTNNNEGDFPGIDIVFKANDYTSSIGTQLEPEFIVNFDNPRLIQVPTVDIEIRPDRDPSLCKAVRVYRNGQIAIAECASSSL